MTCIVGVVDGDRVWVGGDSMSSNSAGEQSRRTEPKVFRRAEYLIGFTTSWRMGQLLHYRLEVPARPETVDLPEWLATGFVDAVRDCLMDGGFGIKREDNVELGGEFLVAVAGRLFHVEDDYQVTESLEGYDACGCGVEVALGALAATKGLSGMGGRKRARLALEAAELHMGGVGGPFLIERY